MQKKIIAYLFLLFIFFTIGSFISMLYINFTTTQLKNVIKLHNVDILRQNLIIKIQNVEQDLLTVHTELSKKLDKIVMNVTDLDSAINNCAACHHSPEISGKLTEVEGLIDQFKTSLSYYITASANEERIKSLRMDSYNIGTVLLNTTSEMVFLAHQTLQNRTNKAIEDVRTAQQILIITLFSAFIVALWIAVTLTRKIIRPIRELIQVSRKIASGNLGYTTTYSDDTEFGELANSINEMSLSLNRSNERNIQHMNRLSGLYRITLPLHVVSNVTEIYREVSYGVADLVGVEQCGLMMLNADSGYFELVHPAFGLKGTQADSLRVAKADMINLYFAHNRRPLIINSVQKVELPSGLTGDDTLSVRNLLLGWVRQKGELVGVIRLANKKDRDFMEDSLRLIGVISNNVSVAIENIRLYEDLKAQMQELKVTQEQLVQTAKLAAIGELASNVAHEINNPLTSIMGYAELIKDETDNEGILKDLHVIERESLRARNIVQQLLEFSRKRPLEIREVDINSLLRESVTLVNVNTRDPRIKIFGEYAELPHIMGDQNQLKQVFLNIINNAVDAMSENGGEINIRTLRKDSRAIIEIQDAGHGIPENVLSRIFEPFFTTKKDKGTGLGLSITYKIVQSHKGSIDVRSEEGKGTKFTISLPVLSSDRLFAQPR